MTPIYCPNCGRILGDTDKTVDLRINCRGCHKTVDVHVFCPPKFDELIIRKGAEDGKSKTQD